MKLGNLDRLIALKDIKPSDLLLNILIDVIDKIISLKNTGVNLDKAVLSDERINDGLPYIC